MTKFYFTESDWFAGYSSRYIEIQCLRHKTRDESDVFA